MANEYADLDTLKAMLNLAADDTTSDALLQQANAAASRGIERLTGRRFWLDPVAVQRTYRVAGRVLCSANGEELLVDDIGTATGLVVETGSGGGWTALTDYETTPTNALADGRPVTSLLRPAATWGHGSTSRVRVTARFGWPTVPDEVVQATQIQAVRLYRRKDSPDGVTGSAEWGVVRLSRVDPDVAELVSRFQIGGFA